MLDYSLNWTMGLVLYKGVNNTARPSKGGPAEAGGFPAMSLL